jgi:hypothetical protein
MQRINAPLNVDKHRTPMYFNIDLIVVLFLFERQTTYARSVGKVSFLLHHNQSCQGIPRMRNFKTGLKYPKRGVAI